MGVGPVGFSVEQQNLLWAMWRRGDSIRQMERTLGETLPRIQRFLRQSGGIPPAPRQRRASHLALVEREEISRGIAAGLSARSIAGRIGRPSSTVSREIVRNGGRDEYRALAADAAAFQRARRPKVSKLAANTELAGVVAAKLDEDWSPQQIAQRLRQVHPGDADSHSGAQLRLDGERGERLEWQQEILDEAERKVGQLTRVRLDGRPFLGEEAVRAHEPRSSAWSNVVRIRMRTRGSERVGGERERGHALPDRVLVEFDRADPPGRRRASGATDGRVVEMAIVDRRRENLGGADASHHVGHGVGDIVAAVRECAVVEVQADDVARVDAEELECRGGLGSPELDELRFGNALRLRRVTPVRDEHDVHVGAARSLACDRRRATERLIVRMRRDDEARLLREPVGDVDAGRVHDGRRSRAHDPLGGAPRQGGPVAHGTERTSAPPRSHIARLTEVVATTSENGTTSSVAIRRVIASPGRSASPRAPAVRSASSNPHPSPATPAPTTKPTP